VTVSIYLDHNATTPLVAAARDAMLPWLVQWGNASSSHAHGRAARAAVERAREQVAALIGAHPDEIVFTSGGTEASNLALRGAAAALGAPGRIVTSVLEHPATLRPCAMLEAAGWTCVRLPSDAVGQVDLAAARAALARPAQLVSLMHAQNETGVLQPVREFAALARAAGARVHVDAAQSAGKVRVDVTELDCDYLTLAAHKFGGPQGVGALYVRRGAPLAPLVVGAGHEGGRRPGTENVLGLVGLGAAAEHARDTFDVYAREFGVLRDDLELRLRAAVPGLVRNGGSCACLPNTLNVSFPRVSGRVLLERCPELCASTGSACHDGHESASAVLLAMGLARDAALGAVRLSLGRGTSAQAVVLAAERLACAWRNLDTESSAS
jgi:cysteine desulfurase